MYNTSVFPSTNSNRVLRSQCAHLILTIHDLTTDLDIKGFAFISYYCSNYNWVLLFVADILTRENTVIL